MTGADALGREIVRSESSASQSLSFGNETGYILAFYRFLESSNDGQRRPVSHSLFQAKLEKRNRDMKNLKQDFS